MRPADRRRPRPRPRPGGRPLVAGGSTRRRRRPGRGQLAGRRGRRRPDRLGSTRSSAWPPGTVSGAAYGQALLLLARGDHLKLGRVATALGDALRSAAGHGDLRPGSSRKPPSRRCSSGRARDTHRLIAVAADAAAVEPGARRARRPRPGRAARRVEPAGHRGQAAAGHPGALTPRWRSVPSGSMASRRSTRAPTGRGSGRDPPAGAQPKRAGRVASCAARSSSRPTVEIPYHAGIPPPVVPKPGHHHAVRRGGRPRGRDPVGGHRHDGPRHRLGRTARRTASPPSTRSHTRAPTPRRSANSTSACARPPSDRSCAASTQAVARGGDQHLARAACSAREVDRAAAAPPRWPCTTCAHSEPPSSSRVVAEQQQRRRPSCREAHRRAPGDVVDARRARRRPASGGSRRRRSGCRS